MIYKRYKKAKGRKEKSELISEFCVSYGCHRKSALRLLNGSPPSEDIGQKTERKKQYSERLIRVIESVWESSGYPWSVRLVETLKLWKPWIRERFDLSEQEESLLLRISAAQIDRRLKSRKRWIKRKVYGSTKAGKILKHQIPIKTDCWNIRRAGWIESDLVSHCGGNASGLFANTLNWTDIASQWVESRCLLGRGQFDVVWASDAMRRELPFDLLGLDCDNDGSFINELLYGYCREKKIQFTRSRPYKKNDNAHIEQKNDTHVRQVLGYVRYDEPNAVAAINELYCNELRLFQNYFRPCVKLVKKIRIGSKVKKRYDRAKTPYQRLSRLKKVDSEKLKEFKRLAESWDPFKLNEVIEAKLQSIFAMASKTPRKWMPPAAHHPKPFVAGPTAFAHKAHSPVEDLRRLYKKEKALQTW